MGIRILTTKRTRVQEGDRPTYIHTTNSTIHTFSLTQLLRLVIVRVLKLRDRKKTTRPALETATYITAVTNCDIGTSYVGMINVCMEQYTKAW